MGNQTTDSKKITAIEAVKEEIARTIKAIDRRIEKHMERANGNYLNFFEWNAEDVYQLHYRRKYYVRLAESLDAWDGVDLVLDLLAMARRKTEEFVRGSLTRNSTSQMANIAHTLGLQVEQELIKEIETLAHLAEHAE